MTLPPLVERGLRVAARSGATHWLRLGAAVVAILCSASALLTLALGRLGPGDDGAALFHLLAWLAWGFCLFEGVRQTADCLSRERREGTLGLLLLTDLKGWEILLGKLAVAALHTLQAVLAMVPVLGVPLLLGGVTGGEVLRVAVALCVSLALTLAAGGLVSSLVEDATQAWLGATILAGLFGLASGVLLYRAFAAQWALAVQPFWFLLGLCGVLTLVLTAIACRTVRAASPTEETTGESFALPVAEDFSTPPPRVRDPAEAEWLAANPALWLARRGDNGAVMLLAVVGGFFVLLGVASALAGERPPAVACLLAVYGLAAVLVTWEACWRMAELRRSGVMELLKTTPLPLATVVNGFKAGLQQRFKRPLLVILGVQMLLPLGLGFTSSPDVGIALIVGLAAGNAWLVAELFALANAGLYFGFRYGNPAQAFGRTIFWTVLLPAIAVPLSGVMCLWPLTVVLLIAKPFMLFGWSNTKLRTDFARLATEPLGTERGVK
jgi:hypothetical protein